MEILIKESEYRIMPYGHVFSANVNSVYEVLRLHHYFKKDEGKRWNRIFFKLKDEQIWMELCEFIRQYFSDEEYTYEIPETEYLGMENERGEFEKTGFHTVR